MLISPLFPLPAASILEAIQVDDHALRHLIWHALQADSQNCETEEFVALCLKDAGVSHGTNGEYEKQFGLLVMRMSQGIRLDAVLETPTIKKLMDQHSRAMAVLQTILPKGVMRTMHLSELRHPVASGFYNAGEYEDCLKIAASFKQNEQPYKVEKI